MLDAIRSMFARASATQDADGEFTAPERRQLEEALSRHFGLSREDEHYLTRKISNLLDLEPAYLSTAKATAEQKSRGR